MGITVKWAAAIESVCTADPGAAATRLSVKFQGSRSLTHPVGIFPEALGTSLLSKSLYPN